MVIRTAVASPPPGDDESYLEWLEASFGDEPSRRRAKRTYRRKDEHRIHVRSQRLTAPDASRMSQALLQAQRQLAQAQAETEARQQARKENGDDQP